MNRMDDTNIQELPPTNIENVVHTFTRELCRLCLHYDNTDIRVNIFEDKFKEGNNEQKSLEEVLYDLFHIKYERTPGMPHVICQRCLDMVKAFNEFRKIIEKSEAKLKSGQFNVLSNKEQYNEPCVRPGLNDNPGIFVPEDDCEIIEVNPEQDFSSSDDDFSMESDTDAEGTREISEPKETANIEPVTSKENSIIIPQKISENVPPLNNEVNVTPKAPEHLPHEYKNAYLCQYCDVAFTNQIDCIQHESQHNPNTPYKCHTCPMHYTSRPILISHIREAHNPEKPYVCMLCTKGFFRRCDLKKHSIVHTGLRPYTCRICSKSFSRNTTLTKHLRIHDSVRPYVCQHCPRSFATAVELMQHGNIHRAPTPNSSAPALTTSPLNNLLSSQHQKLTDSNQMENLIQHPLQLQQQVVTTAITTPVAVNNQKITATPRTSHPRQHICTICSKVFTRERDLQRHQALHLDTLFSCKQCGIGFSRREKLARHELTEHAPHYTCNICNATFLKSEELEGHLKMHELQKNLAISTQQAVLGAASAIQANNDINSTPSFILVQQQQHQQQQQQQQQHHQQQQQTLVETPSAADLSFLSNLVPTMNLGFYSETRTEDSNEL